MGKKLLFTVFIALLTTISVKAYDFRVDGLCYNILNSTGSKSVEVTYETDDETENYSSLSGDIVIPNSVIYNGVEYYVTDIGSNAFKGCKSLISITLPTYMGVIRNNAFEGCELLTSIVLPDYLAYIDEWAFSGCKSLLSVNIPESVTDIGYYAFEKCESLTAINVSSDNKNYCSDEGVLFSKDKTRLIKYPAGKINKDYNIPNGVLHIEDGAFENCRYLASVIIPDGITEIGGYDVFFGCKSLVSVSIPESVTRIGFKAFSMCESLVSVSIPESVTEIDNVAFSGCKSLVSVNIPGNVVRIGSGAFMDCKSLVSIRIPESVTEIEDYAFSECDALTSVYIPNGVTELWGIFRGCNSLVSVNIPESVTLISNTFEGCSALTTVDIPNSVTSIGDKVFAGCISLTSIVIPKDVTFIGNEAFRDCELITSINIPEKVAFIGNMVFSGCKSLTDISVDNNNALFHSEDGILFNKDKSKLIKYPACKSNTYYQIPSSVTMIRECAFDECKNLTSVTIPDNVKSIGGGAFKHCTSLKEMTIKVVVPPTIWETTFEEVDRNIPVYVFDDALEAYKSADIWKEFNLQKMSLSGIESFVTNNNISIKNGMMLNPSGYLICLYDIQGRLVYKGSNTSIKMPSGIYLLRCLGKNTKVKF